MQWEEKQLRLRPVSAQSCIKESFTLMKDLRP